MIDTEKLICDILSMPNLNIPIKEAILYGLEKQDYKYNSEGNFLCTTYTNPLYSSLDDDSVFKIGDTIKNKKSGTTAQVTTYLDNAYGLSNGCTVHAKNKERWEKVLV